MSFFVAVGVNLDDRPRPARRGLSRRRLPPVERGAPAQAGAFRRAVGPGSDRIGRVRHRRAAATQCSLSPATPCFHPRRAGGVAPSAGMTEHFTDCRFPPMSRGTDYTLIEIDTAPIATRLTDLVCVSFARGTRITLPSGLQQPIERLAPGDRVLTRDHGAQPCAGSAVPPCAPSVPLRLWSSAVARSATPAI